MTKVADWVRVYRSGQLTLPLYNGTSEDEGRRAILEAGPGVYELRIDRDLNRDGLTKERIRQQVRR